MTIAEVEIRILFIAFTMKLSPARRVVLLVAVVFLAVPIMQIQVSDRGVNVGGSSLAFWGGLLVLGLLVLEVADRVTMKRDLEIAREIQHWLVPAKPPEVPGADIAFATRPANTVAGDYYDVFPRPGAMPEDDRVFLIVADVAGKSIPAAMLMATLQASLRTLSNTHSSLAQIVTGLNHYASSNSQGGTRFTTAFLAELDPATRKLTYMNAGHNAPILRRGNGVVERLDVGGLPLGILLESHYDSATVALLPTCRTMDWPSASRPTARTTAT